MKTALTLCTITCALFSQMIFAKVHFPVPFGSQEKIIKMRDLPDRPEFQLEDGTYFDIGSMYTIRHIFWLAYSNSESKLVGYVNSQDKYIEFTQEELQNIAAQAKIRLPERAKISFFDKYISKSLLVIILITSCYYGYQYYIKRRERRLQNTDDKGLPWPPNTIHE